jgi:hypothetical protein
MSRVLHEPVEDALCELASESEQRRLWFAASGEVSSFVEAHCRLFDDSGLGPALDRPAVVYTWALDNRLRLLRDLLRQVDGGLPIADLMALPALGQIRTVATALLTDLNNLR